MMSPPAPTTRTSPVPKRTTPSSTPSLPPSITRGASARSAVPPRVNVHTRRASLKSATPPPLQNGHETKESLSASLKQEQEEKERLLLKIQDRDQTIASLSAENTNLTSALGAAEARANELYEDQSRSEIELSNRIDISEKLRAQIRELEKEKRDLQKRYNEQITTFDAERQALYDNEQHLKSRIQTLTQTKKAPVREVHPAEPESEAEMEPQEQITRPPFTERTNEPEQEPAEMGALRLELSTLSTSYSSLHATVLQMQAQLVDLKRVNHELQEENESYMILLRERTLSGQFNPRRQVVGDDGDTDSGDAFSLRSQLERVDEEDDDDVHDEFRMQDDHSLDQPRRSGRQRATSDSTTASDEIPHGESLADLPISGPGLDLAAELGRAEHMVDSEDESPTKKRTKKPSIDQSTSIGGLVATSEVDSLRSEVKALKDANKALSLYASRIIDRIIAEEGFERVLAVDYDKSTPTTDAPPGLATLPPKPPPPKADSASEGSKPRPQSVIVGHSGSNPAASSTAQSLPPITFPSSSTSAGSSAGTTAHKVSAPAKASRRSLSLDWSRFSIFGKTPDPTPNLKPLTLTPGGTPVTSGTARKLDTEEDDDDRKERERLHATMKLMGIQPPTPAQQIMERTSANSSPRISAPPTPPMTAMNRRFSFFNRSSSSVSVQPPNAVGLGINQPANLTQEALVQAEVENSFAALEAHERSLSSELAKGSAGSFTEIQPRSGRRSHRSGDSRSGSNRSGSTVFSAGIDHDE